MILELVFYYIYFTHIDFRLNVIYRRLQRLESNPCMQCLKKKKKPSLQITCDNLDDTFPAEMVEGRLNHVPPVNKRWKLQHSNKYEFNCIFKRTIPSTSISLLWESLSFQHNETWRSLGAQWTQVQILTLLFICHQLETVPSYFCWLYAPSSSGKVENGKMCVRSIGNMCKAPSHGEQELEDGWAYYHPEFLASLMNRNC